MARYIAYQAARTTLVQTLVRNAGVQSLVAMGTGYKVFGVHVDAEIPLPYITVEHYSGGDENDTTIQTSDLLMTVTGHSESEAVALQLQAAINAALNGVMPYCSETAVYAPYTPVTEQYPFTDRYQRQNYVYHKYGGIYRVRLFEK